MLYFSYTPHCIQYYDIIFGYVRQFAGVVMMTGSAILDRYNASARSPLTLTLAPSASGARVSSLPVYELREML